MKVEVNEDGRVVQRIEARQAKVKGVIIEIEGNKVTIESERGREVTVTATDLTRIKLEDDFPGTLADLQVGAEVQVKYDPDSLVAFKFDAEEEEAEIEGVIVEVDGDEVTIETERGRRLTLAVGDRIRIELEDDIPGARADLQVGAEVEAKFDPFTRTAYKIEVDDEAEDEVKQSAQDFAADCNDDGTVSVDRDLEIKGGSGTITSTCVVTIAEGKKLKIVEAILQSGSGSLNMQGGKKTELNIDESTIDLGTGELRFTSEDDSVLVVQESTLRGDPVDLGAAQASPEDRGQLQVSDSVITSTTSNVVLRASEDSGKGQAQVSGSDLNAGGDISIATGEDGQTEVSANTLTAGGSITITA